jgi:putative ABC transport system permease protein
VEQRRREIGVRVALGATPATIWRLIVGGAATAVAPGLVLGAVLAFADARALGALVYGITPLDPVALGGAFLLLALAALASALGPAARATRVSPMRAIQTD